jgi:hypothetical protein
MDYRVPLLAVPLLTMACVSNENNPSPPGVDASIVIPDAGGFDATLPDSAVPDAAPVDVAPQPVTITVRGATGPKAGVTVVFGDGAGAVLATESTDGTGHATHLVPAGSQVTAVFGTVDRPRLVTIVGVEPGDALTAVEDDPDDTFGQLSITSLPAGAPPAVSYDVIAGECGTGGFVTPPSSLYVYRYCQNRGKFPLLARAYDDGSKEIGFVAQKVNSLVPDGGVPDGGVVPVAIAGTWSTTYTTNKIGVTNAPGNLFPELVFSEYAGGIPFWSTKYFDLPDGGPLTADFVGHVGFADFVQREAKVRLSTSAGVSGAAIATRAAAPTASDTVTFDLAQLLPRLTAATLEPTGAGRPTATWASTASLAGTDGALVQIHWYAPNDGNGVYGSWTLVVPPTATSVQMPALPASVASFAPPADANLYSPPTVIFIDGSFVPGYAQLRATATDIPPTRAALNDNGGPYVPPLPVDGTMRVTTYTANGD